MLWCMEIASLFVSILALGISAYIGWLRYQDTQAEPDLRLDMDWIIGGGGPSTLRIVAENRGKARGGVRNIVLSPGENHDPKTAYGFLHHLDELPVMLDPGHFARFPIDLDPNARYSFTQGLLSGHFTHAILIDQDRMPRAFTIPSQPEQQDNRVSLAGRVVKG